MCIESHWSIEILPSSAKTSGINKGRIPEKSSSSPTAAPPTTKRLKILTSSPLLANLRNRPPPSSPRRVSSAILVPLSGRTLPDPSNDHRAPFSIHDLKGGQSQSGTVRLRWASGGRGGLWLGIQRAKVAADESRVSPGWQEWGRMEGR